MAESFLCVFENRRTILTLIKIMAKSLAEIMPNLSWLCVWHIMQNAITYKAFGNLAKNDSGILKEFKACIYDYEDESKFHEVWYAFLNTKLMETHGRRVFLR